MWGGGSGVCSGSLASSPVAPIDGVSNKRKVGWTRKMARERERVLRGELLGVLITKLSSNFLKKKISG